MAAERLYVLGDIGGTNARIGVYNEQGEAASTFQAPTDPQDYEGTIERLAETVEILAQRGEVVAASVAVAASVDEEGVLYKSGALTPWLGNNLRVDLEESLGLDEGLVGTHNDMVAAALSQQEINIRNGRPARGVATTLSTGWGGALYWEEGRTMDDEPGHEHLREGGTCPCGEEGHAEAFVSGIGVEINEGISMSDWLSQVPGAANRLVTDLSDATVAMLERHAKADYAFLAEEVRWTGSVALNHPFIIQRVAAAVREQIGPVAFDLLTMGEQAGLHGTFIDAGKRAREY